MRSRSLYRVLLLTLAFGLTNCSLSPFGDSQPEGRSASVTASVCESQANDGVWVGSAGEGGVECHCYSQSCCDAIGGQPNVACFLE